MRALAVAALVIVVTASLPPPEAAAAGGPTTAAVVANAERRAEFGLPSDLELVRELMQSDDDIGSALWGIPMTSAEAAEVDLEGRMAFAISSRDGVLEQAAGLAGYAGAYFDQLDGGRLVVQLLYPDWEAEEQLLQRVPPGPGLSFEYVAFAERELRRAMAEIWDAWPTLFGDTTLHAVILDTRANSVVVEVDEEAVPGVETRLGLIEAKAGVRVLVRSGEPDVDAVCSDRDNCYDPLKAGVRILRGSPSEGSCTMAFHIYQGSSRRFVTAGHCGYTGSNNWFHSGYPFALGSELATLYAGGPVTPRRDIMYVGMPATQASTKVYGQSGNVSGSGDPYQGEAVCASMAQSNTRKCGTVTDTLLTYNSNTCSCSVQGADTSLTAIEGDSGSPIYEYSTIVGVTYITAIGVLGTAGGRFARLDDALDIWGHAVVQ